MHSAALHVRPTASRHRRAWFLVTAAALAAVAIVALLGAGRDGAPAAPVPVPAAVAPATGAAPHAAVPILMYHVIGPTTNPPRFRQLWVSRRALQSHVRALRRAGYHGVTLQEVWDAWHHGGELPGKPVVFSFDDGYAGHARDALPILAAAGWPGVLNLQLSRLQSTGGTRAVQRLVAGGWEIDSHTLTHRDLTTLDDAALQRELVDSKARIARLFDVPVNFFAYPNGRYDARVVAAVRDAGYRAATTVKPGYAQPGADPYTLPRIRVDGGKGSAWLLRKLRALRPT